MLDAITYSQDCIVGISVQDLSMLSLHQHSLRRKQLLNFYYTKLIRLSNCPNAGLNLKLKNQLFSVLTCHVMPKHFLSL